MTTEQDYVPFGEEWKKEVKKLSKDVLIEQWRSACLEIQRLSAASPSPEGGGRKIKYVVGFMFNANETDVLLIEKKKPRWQLGKFNGIGGKIESGEDGLRAMIREFKEETGIDFEAWNFVVKMCGDDWEVEVFTATTNAVFDFETMEEESVNLIPIRDIDQYEHISNLQWLIPMCLDTYNIDYKISTP